ncbi:MAG: hypothetical protein L0154_15600 [Chloroflexi bacterium]|nr:hypothetical protein [Chloroflexota bacterium]
MLDEFRNYALVAGVLVLNVTLSPLEASILSFWRFIHLRKPRAKFGLNNLSLSPGFFFF